MEVTEEERTAMWDAISAGEEPPIPPEPQDGAEELAPVKDAIEPEVDHWASVPPAIKESFDSMSAKVASFDAMSLRLKQAESRIGALQNKLNQIPHEPTAEEKQKAEEDIRKWQALKDEDPELAEVMERRFARTNEVINQQRVQYESAGQALQAKIKELEDNLTLRIEKSTLSQKYPDWEEIVKLDEYRTWLDSQTPDIKEKTRSMLAKDAIAVLDKFAKERRKSPSVIAEERKQRLNASVMVSGTPSKAVKSVDDMTIEEYREYLAKELWQNSKR